MCRRSCLLSLLLGTGQPGSDTCPGHEAASAVLLETYGHLGCLASSQGIAYEPSVLDGVTCMTLDLQYLVAGEALNIPS